MSAQYTPPDLVKAWNDVITEAEERGRRTGIEEAAQEIRDNAHRLLSGDELAETILALVAPAQCTERMGDHRCDEGGPHEQHRAENAGEGGADLVWKSALAPRDSGKEG